MSWGFAVACAGCLLLFAQAAYAAPSDVELLSQRAVAAEAQNQYLLMLLQRAQSEAEKTAVYWAEIWKALPQPQQIGEANGKSSKE